MEENVAIRNLHEILLDDRKKPGQVRGDLVRSILIFPLSLSFVNSGHNSSSL